MARRKYSRYARLLKEGDKFYQPDTYLGDIWTVKRVAHDCDMNGSVKVFVENRKRAFVMGMNDRVKLHYSN